MLKPNDPAWKTASAAETKTAASKEALKALQDMIAAANRLDNHWQSMDDTLNGGYPKYLPSFDEFVNDLETWQEAVKKASK